MRSPTKVSFKCKVRITADGRIFQLFEKKETGSRIRFPPMGYLAFIAEKSYITPMNDMRIAVLAFFLCVLYLLPGCQVKTQGTLESGIGIYGRAH